VTAIGINTWVWTSPLTDASLPDLLDTIAAMGFDGVELPLENVGDLDPDATAAALKEAGLSAWVVGAMAPGRDLVATTPATIARTQNYLRACVDLAVAVGAPAVCGPFYAQTGRVWQMTGDERTAAYAEWRENLRPVAEYAGERGVRIGIEPLNRYETSMVNTVDQAITGLGSLLGPAVGLALDTYHLNIEERSSAAAIRAAGENLVHLQVCGNDRGSPGHDQTDWSSLRDALDEIDYAGALTIESFTPDNAAIAVAASIWRPLAASPEDLARDGLTFLRSVFTERPEAGAHA
jgi:D-psicose/D-tagatose/L-ribulose 3-epimerase